MTTRALGLVRVSKERDGLVSPEIQRTAILDHAERHGHTVTRWLEGIDESGSQARSKWWATLDAAVELVEQGEVEVLLVWKFSRLARQRLRWAVAVDRVETAGGRIESATEGFDTTTSSGRFARGMLGELQAFEAERIGEVWRDVHTNRIGKGLTHNGRARFGYVYDRAAGVHRVDPETGPVLADLYLRYVAGETPYGLAADLNRRGLRTTAGGLWTDGTLRRVLDSGFGAGLLLWGGGHVDAAHDAVIGPDLWAAYLDAKRGRSRVAPRSQRSPYLLSGLVRCAWCEGAMTAGTFGKGRHPKYRCETRRATAGQGCAGGGYVAAEHVHDAVFAWLRSIADDLDGAARRAAADGSLARAASTDDADRLAREVTRLEAALVRLAQQHAEDEGSDEAVYRAARDDYRRRLDDARTAHADALGTARRLEVPPAVVVRPLVDEWHTLGVEGRREALRRLVRHVMVRTHDRGTPAGVRVVPLWETVSDSSPRASRSA